MAEPHEFDLVSGWCKRCGIARADAIDSGKACIESAGNVTAISHIVRGSELRSVAASILLERRGFFDRDDPA